MPNFLSAEIDEDRLRDIVVEYFAEILGVNVSKEDVKILVKSRQNFKSEWEEANFKAAIHKRI